MPACLHLGWNFFQRPIFGVPVSGAIEHSLIVQEAIGSDLLIGGANGRKFGLLGMAFRFVRIALLLCYLHLRVGRQGEIKSLNSRPFK